jgi:hypothetical protein
MLYRFTLFFFAITLLISCNNSTKNAASLQGQIDTAISYNDINTAIYYSHELIALEGTADSVSVRLAGLYMLNKNYVGATKLAEELLPTSSKENQLKLWQIKAESFANAGVLGQAIAAYDTLGLLHPQNALDYKYEIGVLYFKARDIQRGVSTMQEVIQNPASKTKQTKIRSDWGEEQVSYYLAALNYIGYIKIETKQFEDAAKIYAEIQNSGTPFKLAANNMSLLKKRQETPAQ